MQDYEKRIEKLKEMIKNSSRAVFFGGAGVSTASGVKDYRSEDGLYNTVKEYGVSPETILSHSFFLAHPDTFYDFYRKYFLQEGIKPNGAHYALARLEEQGKLKAVITQNIDSLHQAAGSKNVLELHGSGESYYCMNCRAEYTAEKIKNESLPKCDKCGGLIKPKVVLYEEMLNEVTTDTAIDYIYDADLLIIGGTSLAVYPAAAFVGYFKGKNLVLINRTETSYDNKATLIFREDIDKVLTDAVDL